MFSHITENWRGRPLFSREVVVTLIANASTSAGLSIQAELDHAYPVSTESSVKSEHKLVEIALQVFWANSVVCSQEPRIQVSEHNVDHWEMLIRLGLITPD